MNECSRSVAEHGIYVSNSGDRPVIHDNKIWGNYANGIHMNGDLSQGGDGIISGAQVFNNIIYGNGVGGGSGINCDGVRSSVISNNLLYENHASGISLYRIDGAAGSTDNLVVNNTIIPAADGRWPINIKNQSTGNVVTNNILLNRNTGRGSIDIAADSLPRFVSDYNLVMDRFTPDDGTTFLTLADWRTQTGQDSHSIIAAIDQTTFVDPANNDYHLAANSPAIDHGLLSDAPPGDLELYPRPIGAGVDIGAYESHPADYCGSQQLGCDGGTGGGTDGGTDLDGGIGGPGQQKGCACSSGGSASLVAGVLLVIARWRPGSRRRGA